MRIAALFVPALLLVLGSCGSSAPKNESSFAKPNTLIASEIQERIDQIPFQHRDELLRNLLWLQQTGEPAIESLLGGMRHTDPKVRSSCAWVLGRIGDRRTIPMLKAVAGDQNETVRLEIARSLVLLGDLQQTPLLIEGLDSDKKEVRFLCHEALKTATGRDFGFDHLSENAYQRHAAVYGWRQWWAEYAGDAEFAQVYREQHQIGEPAMPAGETRPQSGQGTDGMGQGNAMPGGNVMTDGTAPTTANGNNGANRAGQTPMAGQPMQPMQPMTTPGQPPTTQPTTQPKASANPVAPGELPMQDGSSASTGTSTAPGAGVQPTGIRPTGVSPAGVTPTGNTGASTGTNPSTPPAPSRGTSGGSRN